MPAVLPPAPHATVDWGIVAVFAIVYLGMFLGGLPKFKLDRSGVALLGAIAVIGIGALDTEQAARAVDLPVNHAFETTGLAAQAVGWLAAQGVHLADPGPLFVAGLGLSNLVSNVPAVMLLIPHLSGPNDSQWAATALALVSTFAGNLLLVGSIANLIVVDLARKSGIEIDWRGHARIGVPITLATLAIVWFWLRWMA